jgi:hypothetical protein
VHLTREFPIDFSAEALSGRDYWTQERMQAIVSAAKARTMQGPPSRRLTALKGPSGKPGAPANARGPR